MALGELLLHLIRAINHDTRDRGLLSNGDGKRPPFVLFPTNHFFLEKWVQCTMFLKEIENALLSCKFMSNTLFFCDQEKNGICQKRMAFLVILKSRPAAEVHFAVSCSSETMTCPINTHTIHLRFSNLYKKASFLYYFFPLVRRSNNTPTVRVSNYVIRKYIL